MSLADKQETTMRIAGCITDLLTPFRNGMIDEEAFTNLLEFQRRCGVEGVNIGSLVGEGPCLSETEIIALVRMARCVVTTSPVLATVCTNNTEVAIARGLELPEAGVDAIVYPTPYYNKPSAKGVVTHFEAICDALRRPILIQYDPLRSGPLHSATIQDLVRLPSVIGFRDDDPDPWRRLNVIRATRPDTSIFSGCASLMRAYAAAGGTGCFSSLSNIFPAYVLNSLRTELRHQFGSEMLDPVKIANVAEEIDLDETPASLKFLASHFKLMSNHVRLPNAPLDAVSEAKIEALLK